MANFKYKINIKDIQDRYKFKVFMRSGADIPKAITDDISSIKNSNEELKRSIEELKSETNKIIEENIKKKSQNQNMYNALRTIYTNNIKDKVVEKINLLPDIGEESAKWQNLSFWSIDRTQKLEDRYVVRMGTPRYSGITIPITYKQPGQYKFSAYIKTSVDNEPVAIYGAAKTTNKKETNRTYIGTREWQKIELIFYKVDIDVPDLIRVEKKKLLTRYYIYQNLN